jgi:hypothetical protein
MVTIFFMEDNENEVTVSIFNLVSNGNDVTVTFYGNNAHLWIVEFVGKNLPVCIILYKLKFILFSQFSFSKS